MAQAKKLASGSWRCQVFSHWETMLDKKGKPILDDKGKPKKKRVYKSFTSTNPSKKGKREAEAMAADFALNKEYLSDSVNYTVEEAIVKYIESKNNILSPTTLRGYNTLLRNSFDDILDLKISNLSQNDIQIWVNNLMGTISPKTLRNAHGLLSATLAMYVPNLRLKTTLPMQSKPELYTPSDGEIKKLLDYIKDTDLEVAVLLGAFGAMRRGEICALTDADVNGNVITINKSLVRNDKGGLILKTPKTTSSYRYVEMPQFVIDRIKDIDGRLVKTHPEDISKNFGNILKESGLPHFRFHDLRHYSASIMHAIGIPDQYIMARGGWKTDRVLKDVYRNVIDSENDKFVKKINSHFDSMQHEMQHDIEKTP